MKIPHVAFFTIPAPVHVNPTISIVSVLVRRGYRVTYVTSQRHAEELTGLGAEVVRCPRFEFPFDQRNSNVSLPIDQQYATTLTDLASRTLGIASAFYESEPPDLVIFDTHSYAGLLLAERLKIPSVRVTSHLVADEEATFNYEKLHKFFLQYGVRRSNPLLNRDGLTVYLFADDLQVGDPPENSAHFYAARCAAERHYRSARHMAVRDRDRDLSIVSCSTFYVQGSDYYRMCMEALSQLRRPAVLAIAAQADAASLGPLRCNCTVAQGIPLLALMPQAGLLIFQGGMATTMEAIYHGLPMLVLTQGHSQLETYADNIQKHCLGIHLRKADATVDNVRRSIVQLAEDSRVRESVKRMQAIVRGSPGAEEVANTIEESLLGAPHSLAG